jgi:hypothetical protein
MSTAFFDEARHRHCPRATISGERCRVVQPIQSNKERRTLCGVTEHRIRFYFPFPAAPTPLSEVFFGSTFAWLCDFEAECALFFG